MQLARPLFAPDPRGFGRARPRPVEVKSPPAAIIADLKLFTTAFVAAFVFVSILIG